MIARSRFPAILQSGLELVETNSATTTFWRSQSMRRISFGLFTSSVLGVFLISLCATGAFAQGTTTGTIHGSVKDQNGAVVAGASVTAKNEATGAERKATSG